MIGRADVFQLFWSRHATRSKSVEEQWRHALGLGRSARHFIRPVYWEQPMPSAPPELGDLHFTCVRHLGRRCPPDS